MKKALLILAGILFGFYGLAVLFSVSLGASWKTSLLFPITELKSFLNRWRDKSQPASAFVAPQQDLPPGSMS